MREIKFHGRGGQGVVLASQILGLALFKAGLYPQCYSLFGGERRGAPVVSFLRVDRDKILLKCGIKLPHDLICFDPALIAGCKMEALVRPGGRILVGAPRTGWDWEAGSGLSLGLVDAPAIAAELGLGHAVNTVLLGAYCRMSGLLSLEHLEEALWEMVPASKEANLEAVRRGYTRVVVGNMES